MTKSTSSQPSASTAVDPSLADLIRVLRDAAGSPSDKDLGEDVRRSLSRIREGKLVKEDTVRTCYRKLAELVKSCHGNQVPEALPKESDLLRALKAQRIATPRQSKPASSGASPVFASSVISQYLAHANDKVTQAKGDPIKKRLALEAAATCCELDRRWTAAIEALNSISEIELEHLTDPVASARTACWRM